MKSTKLYFSILLSIFFLESCEKEIVFNGEVTTPLVVVNSFITPDSVISAHVSESRFFLKDSITFRNINNAEVSIWVNGVFKETMNFLENGLYKGTYKPAIGETIKLVVKAPTKNEVTSEAIILPKTEIINLDTTNIWTGQRYQIQSYGNTYGSNPTIYTYDTITISGHQINYTLKFKDNENEKNFYRLVVIIKEYNLKIDTLTNDTTISINDNYNFNFSDVVSGNNANNDPFSMSGYASGNIYNVFSDDLFNGKTYSLSFKTNEDIFKYTNGYPYKPIVPFMKIVNIYLQSISKDYYLYLKSRPAASGGIDFFSEAVQVHNNIIGGIGILGSYTSSNAFSVELKQ